MNGNVMARATSQILGGHEVVELYRRRAQRYDLSWHLYWLLGYPVDRYRREGVAALRLRPGDTVVELGCGTGVTLVLFPVLAAACVRLACREEREAGARFGPAWDAYVAATPAFLPHLRGRAMHREHRSG